MEGQYSDMNKTPIVRTVLKRKFRLYLALAVILAFTILGYLMIDGNDFFGGLLTEVVGMCLTVFILDFIIATNEERRNYKIGRLAMLQIRSQLTRLFELLREQYKAVNNSALAPTYSIDLFTEENATAICSRLDPDAVCPVIYERPKTWEVHNALFIEAFKNNLDLIVDKYLLYLPEDLVEAIEKIEGFGYV